MSWPEQWLSQEYLMRRGQIVDASLAQASIRRNKNHVPEAGCGRQADLIDK